MPSSSRSQALTKIIMGRRKNNKKARNKQPKKTNVSETSKQCWKEINKEGIPQREKPLVLKAIRELQPCTSRMLMHAVNKERSNITRSLYDLVRSEAVKIAFTAKCRTTNRSVSYYSIIDWKEDPQ